MSGRTGGEAGGWSEWRVGRLRGQWAVVRTRGGQRQRHIIGAKEEALREAERLNRPEERAGTVGACWAAYVHARAGRAIIETMRHTEKALRPIFWHLEPTMVTLDHCREHVATRRAAGISDGTLHNELGHLRMVLRWAAKAEMIAKAPEIERPAKPAPRDEHLTRDEFNALLGGAVLPHVRLYLVLLITTSARIGALLELTWDRVDMERARIHLTDPDDPVRRKGRATVPINRSAMAALQEAREGALTPYVIEWAGERVHSVKKSLRTAATRAGLDKRVSPHMLRHSAAVWLVEAGRPMEEIAQFLGHRDLSVTRRIYARFSDAWLADAAKVLELDWSRRRKA